jgi:ADP-heptose:LPS heptosyltransferase
MDNIVSYHGKNVLIHLASGIGNIILSTPLLIACSQMHLTIDILLSADYPETVSLLESWSVIRTIYVKSVMSVSELNSYDVLISAIPPFYWSRYAHVYTKASQVVKRPPATLFYQNEQAYYLAFAHELGYPAAQCPLYRLPIAPSEGFGITGRTLALAPGCKTGEMAAKRWPYFPQLAERFEDVVLVGTADDLCQRDGTAMQFPPHARCFVDALTLRETAELLASVGAVVGNDSGLAHVAAAVGTPTVMLFGPTPHRSLGHFPPNITVLRTGLECEPCWFTSRFRACAARIHCLHQLTVEIVEQEVKRLLGIT